MTIFQAHHLAFCALLETIGDQNEARAGARLLTDHLTGLRHAHLTQPSEVLPKPQQARFQTALQELGNQRPLAYILGERDFYGLSFLCDERALIPRPETELLVEFALNSIAECGVRIADLGTGSGCVAIAIAINAPGAQIFATDVSPLALELASENARAHNVAERVKFVLGNNGDWAAPLLAMRREYSQSKTGGVFDVIVSNPPYIAPRDIEELPKQIKDFEPLRALDGGPDGMDCYRQIAGQCVPLLKPNGILACELGAQQFADARAIFESQNWRVEKPIFDFAGIERVLVAKHLV